MTSNEWDELSLNASKVFTPAAPVDERQLFAGRIDQLRQVVDVIHQKGQHAIIFGERGVGKTSLANILAKISSPMLAIRKNCDSSDNYHTLWEKIFNEIILNKETQQIGFTGEKSIEFTRLMDDVKGQIIPDIVRQILTRLASKCTPIIILDEFDRIPVTVQAASANSRCPGRRDGAS